MSVVVQGPWSAKPIERPSPPATAIPRQRVDSPYVSPFPLLPDDAARELAWIHGESFSLDDERRRYWLEIGYKVIEWIEAAADEGWIE